MPATTTTTTSLLLQQGIQQRKMMPTKQAAYVTNKEAIAVDDCRKIYIPAFRSCISPCLSSLYPDKPARKKWCVMMKISQRFPTYRKLEM